MCVWDGEIGVVREERNKMCDLLGLPRPKLMVNTHVEVHPMESVSASSPIPAGEGRYFKKAQSGGRVSQL